MTRLRYRWWRGSRPLLAHRSTVGRAQGCRRPRSCGHGSARRRGLRWRPSRQRGTGPAGLGQRIELDLSRDGSAHPCARTGLTAELRRYLDQGGAMHAAGRHLRRPLALGSPDWRAPALTSAAAADQSDSPGTRRECCAVSSSGLSSVLLPAAASRSLPAVASHPIAFAEPRCGHRSPGIRRLRGRRAGMKIETSGALRPGGGAAGRGSPG